MGKTLLLNIDSTDDSVRLAGLSSRRVEDMTKSSVSCSSVIGSLMQRTTPVHDVLHLPRMDGSDSPAYGSRTGHRWPATRRSPSASRSDPVPVLLVGAASICRECLTDGGGPGELACPTDRVAG